MHRDYLVFLVIAALVSIVSLRKLANNVFAVVPGWHTTLFSRDLLIIIGCITGLYVCVSCYFLLRKKPATNGKSFLLLHLVTILPLLILYLSSPGFQLLISKGYGWILYPILIICISGQLLFLGYFIKTVLSLARSH